MIIVQKPHLETARLLLSFFLWTFTGDEVLEMHLNVYSFVVCLISDPETHSWFSLYRAKCETALKAHQAISFISYFYKDSGTWIKRWVQDIHSLKTCPVQNAGLWLDAQRWAVITSYVHITDFIVQFRFFFFFCSPHISLSWHLTFIIQNNLWSSCNVNAAVLWNGTLYTLKHFCTSCRRCQQ